MSFLQSSSGQSRSKLELRAFWDLCCDWCGMKWKAEEWTMWLFSKTKVGDTEQNFDLGAAHVLQNCKQMPLCLLLLWVSMARNKLWAHKEQTTFQERAAFGSSTSKRVCKAQPLPHPTHASYKRGIRKIPFICADSFPALGFSDFSFIWLTNLFLWKCGVLVEGAAYPSFWSAGGESAPGEVGMRRDLVEGWVLCRAEIYGSVLPSLLQYAWYDSFLSPSHLYPCHIGSFPSSQCFSINKNQSFVSDDLNVQRKMVLPTLWDSSDPLPMVQPCTSQRSSPGFYFPYYLALRWEN